MKRNKMHFNDLKREVIDRILCMGCGMCAGICPLGGVEMLHVDHELEPVLTGECNACSLCYDVCPGQDIPMPALDRMVFGRERQPEKELLGITRNIMAAHAADPKIRAAGASGGAATALLVYALEQGFIDGAMVAQMNPKEPWYSMPVLATTREDIIASASSRYTVVSTNAALREVIKGKYKKIAHVGLGCHTEGMRKLQLLYPKHKINESVAFFIGINCGETTSPLSTKLRILEGGGVHSLDEVANVNHRGKPPDGGIAMKITKKDGSVVYSGRFGPLALAEDYFLGRGSLSFRLERCLVCTDFCSELADITVGDYHGPQIPEEGKHLGWTIIYIKTEKGEQIVKDAEAKGYLITHSIDARFPTLGGGFYMKKHGYVHNLMKRKRYGWPVPDFHYPPVLEPVVRDFPYDPTLWPDHFWSGGPCLGKKVVMLR